MTAPPTLDHRAERVKFARIFGLPEASLGWVDEVELEDLQRVRRAAEARLFAVGGDKFRRLNAASRLLPNVVVAKIAQVTVGPLLGARTAGLVEPERAADLVRHVSPRYLAQMAMHLDPSTVEDIVPALPVDVMVAVAEEILPTGDWVTMGRMVGLAPPHAVRPLIDAVGDDEGLLRIAFMLEHRERLGPIVDEVPDERILAVARVAHEQDLWVEGVALMTFVDEDRRRRIGRLATQSPPEVLDSLIRAATTHGLWSEVLAVVALQDDEHLGLVAGIPALVEPDTLAAVVAACEAEDRWTTLVRVVALMPASHQQAVAAGLRLSATQRRRAEQARAALDLDPATLGPAAASLS